MSSSTTSSALYERLHDRACQQGRDSYIDAETGQTVFTAIYLKRQGYCCDNRCRHCPYGE